MTQTLVEEKTIIARRKSRVELEEGQEVVRTPAVTVIILNATHESTRGENITILIVEIIMVKEQLVTLHTQKTGPIAGDPERDRGHCQERDHTIE